MIIVKLQGGLGNQLFQWAIGKSLSISNDVEFILDDSFYNLNLNTITKRVITLDKYPFLKDKISSNINLTKPLIKLNDDFIYKKINIDNNYDYYLDGYWQSEKHFLDNKNTILDSLCMTNDIKNTLLFKYPQLIDNCVSLHIRRTDYVTSNGFHPVQDLLYYNKALEIIGDYDHIFIFSDDISWCKENLKYDNMIFVENNQDYEDMWIMSLCKNNIIANSSFSWWGAYMNTNIDKKVIAPSKWFGDNSNLNISDIIPNKWIKI